MMRLLLTWVSPWEQLSRRELVWLYWASCLACLSGLLPRSAATWKQCLLHLACSVVHPWQALLSPEAAADYSQADA